VAALAGGFMLLRAADRAPPPLSTPEGNVAAYAPAGLVLALGRLVPRDRILVIAPPFGAGDARVASLPVPEGGRVAAGDVLAVMDSEPMLRAALAAAEANVASRAAALEQTRVQVAAARDEARGALARAEAALPILRRDYERAATLSGRGAATEQAVDQRRLVAEQAEQDAVRARAALRRYDAPDPDAQVDVVVAWRALDAAIAERDRARADLEKAYVRAPSAGTVLTIRARPGGKPGNDGIMTFGALDDMIAEVEIYEDRIRALAPGAAVTLRGSALPAPLAGTLGQVGVEVMRQTLTDAGPAANTDARVVRAVIELDPASAATAARVVGLQVTARIEAAR
jgi:HlyD family secretion protein